MTFHKCQFVKKAFLLIFIFWLFLKWVLFGVFFFGFGSGLFLTFFSVFALGCVISFSCCAFGCWAPCCFFFRSSFLCVFLFVFSLLFGRFSVPFWSWVLGAVLFFFRSGFLGVFLFVFSLLFGLFSVPFWPWVLGAVLLFFRSGFLGVFWCFFPFL